MHEWQGNFHGGHLCTPGRNAGKPLTTAAWTGLRQPEPAESQTMAENACGSWFQNLQLTPHCQVRCKVAPESWGIGESKVVSSKRVRRVRNVQP